MFVYSCLVAWTSGVVYENMLMGWRLGSSVANSKVAEVNESEEPDPSAYASVKKTTLSSAPRLPDDE